MADPYAEFGGQTVQKPAADPYAEFGGNAVQKSAQQTPSGTISNAPTGPLAWLKNLEGDVRYGTGTTLPGRLLKGMGAPGVNAGQGAEVANQVASPILGPIRAAQGVAEIKSQPWQGAQDIVGGALQTATLPGAFVGPPAASRVLNKIPSATFAGQALSEVKSIAGDLPINVGKAGDVALRIKDIADSGATMPKVISNFLRRVTDPAKGELTFAEAREFYSNASSKLSLEEAGKLTSKMKFQLSQFARALNQSIQETANVAGQGDKYAAAMKEYAAASRNSARLDLAKEMLGNATKVAIPGAAGAYTVKKIIDAR